jgi:hypothetical protein
MSRIRSVHPGLFTDEAFVSLSPIARVLLIGVWTECDDRGAFEWKPVTLKMKILPADNADVGKLLEELKAANAVRSYELAGRQYGAVRNFCRYQRPKKPKYIHPIDDEFDTYVASSAASSAPVLPKSEISPQMEDGGGRREGEKKAKNAAQAAADENGKYAFESGIIRLSPKDFAKWQKAYSHLDLAAELMGLTKWAGEQGPENWFFAVSGALAKRNRDVKIRTDATRNGQLLTPDGQPWPEGIT